MNDKDKPVESTINLSLKSKAKGSPEKATTELVKEEKKVEKKEVQDSQRSNNIHSDEQSRQEGPAYVGNVADSKKSSSKGNTPPAATIEKEKNTSGKKGLIFTVLGAAFCIMLFLPLLINATKGGNVGNNYFVESTISLPSEIETEQEALVLSSCVIDYSFTATPSEMIELVHNKYSYIKGENDLVQNLVSTGCDLSVNPPTITIGSFFKALMK